VGAQDRNGIAEHQALVTRRSRLRVGSATSTVFGEEPTHEQLIF